MTESAEASSEAQCRLCGAAAHPLGVVYGDFSGRDYELWRCGRCRFAFIGDPWTEFGRIYDDRYYTGQGADPLVDYRFELAHADRTIRRYEWNGIVRVVEELLGRLDGLSWLDFGCGNGGLVRHLLAYTGVGASGFEQGSIAREASKLGVPIISEQALEEHAGGFDVVTAIEVLEHTLDPLAELRRIRRLLRPGGLLFVTTGNAAPFAARLPKWSYVVPEIHISLFEPETLAYAMREAGFRPEQVSHDGGFDQILKFKLLKNLRIRRRNRMIDLVPARPLAALVERRLRLGEHPVGWAS